MLLYFVLLLVGRCTSEYAWNNSGFEYPDPWPVEHCEVPPAEARVCMEDKSFSSQFLTCTPESCNITVAIIFPSDPEYLVNLDKASETLNEAAMAVKKFYQEEKNINFNFNLSPFDDRCLPEYASVQMIKVNEIFAHVVFGSVCDFCLASMGRIGKYLGYYGLPLLTPGGLTTDFTTKKQQCTDEFYMVMNTGIVDYRSFAEFFHLILERYKWKKIGVMYNKTTQTALAGEKACQLIVSSILQDTQKDAQSFDGDLVLSDMTPDKFLKTVIGTEYGIILTCLSSRMFRDFAITAYDLNFIGDGEYTIFNFETYNDAPNPLRPWEYPDDPKGNAKARKAFKSVYTFRSSDQAHLQTNKNVGQVYWDSMYDAMFLYAHGLYHTIQGQPNTGEPYSIKGYEIVQNMMGTTYQGKSRNVTMNCNGQRVSEYVMMHVNDSGNYQIVARYTNLNKTIIEWKDDWVNGVPKETPVCGYDMSLCPKFDTVNVLIISLVLVLVLGILIVGVMLYRHFKLKAAIYSMAWKVNHDEIIMFPVKPRQSFQSTMSLQKMEMDGLSMAGDRQLYTTIGFYKTNRIAIKYLADVKFELSHEQLRELKSMKDLSHDNLVKFCGASLDIPNCILTEYCAKGSLQDILENDQVQLDIDFKMSLIMDVLRGMTYLHASVFRSHGALKSSNCLIDSRFVLKIADFGLHFLRKHFGQEEDNDMLESHSYWERQLWTAPELLKMEAPPPEGTPKGDVYSFAFIMHEIIVRKGVFHLEEFMSAKGLNREVANLGYQNNG